jgi:hypothetical protein
MSQVVRYHLELGDEVVARIDADGCDTVWD